MIVIFGLIVLVDAAIIGVVGVVGVLGNGGSGHALPHGFAVFGYHVTGSTGTLFRDGGRGGRPGRASLLAGARRTSRRGRAARRGLRQSRRETAAVSQDRDDLIGQRDTARAYTASTLGNGTPGSDSHHGAGGRRSGLRLFGHQFARRHAVAGPPESVTGPARFRGGVA